MGELQDKDRKARELLYKKATAVNPTLLRYKKKRRASRKGSFDHDFWSRRISELEDQFKRTINVLSNEEVLNKLEILEREA